jgi:hypothetical protein
VVPRPGERAMSDEIIGVCCAAASTSASARQCGRICLKSQVAKRSATNVWKPSQRTYSQASRSPNDCEGGRRWRVAGNRPSRSRCEEAQDDVRNHFAFRPIAGRALECAHLLAGCMRLNSYDHHCRSALRARRACNRGHMGRVEWCHSRAPHCRRERDRTLSHRRPVVRFLAGDVQM